MRNRSGSSESGGRLGEETLQGSLDHREVGGLFGGEVQVEAALAGIGGVGHCLDGGAAEAKAAEVNLGGFDQAVTGWSSHLCDEVGAHWRVPLTTIDQHRNLVMSRT